jgi:hypothetical protein
LLHTIPPDAAGGFSSFMKGKLPELVVSNRLCVYARPRNIPCQYSAGRPYFFSKYML